MGQPGGRRDREIAREVAIKTQNYQTENHRIGTVTVKVTSYQIGKNHFCHVANLDPGATISRGKGSTLQEARQAALEKATRRLGF